MSKTTVLITGASTGIGAVYADRFARRGHDLVLVARDKVKLESLAARLQQENNIFVDVLPADLTQTADLTKVEARLREDDRISILVNNAGIAQSGRFLEQTPELIERLIALNVTALTRLSCAVAPRFVKAGEGSVINISSIVGLAPELAMTLYGATKAFVLSLSQGMHFELSSAGVYVQAVLPAGTKTEIWKRAEIDTSNYSAMMDVGDMVDAALVGFDRRELVTIPPLHDGSNWDVLDSARLALVSDIRQAEVVERYRTL